MRLASLNRLISPSRAMLASLLVLACSGTPASADVTVSDVPQSPSEIRSYWTPERMQAAETLPPPQLGGAPDAAPPVARSHGRATRIASTPGIANIDYEPGAETGYPQSVHGKIFFTVPGVGDAACSGTLVASRLRNVVFTAGHCVHFPGDQPSVNLVFIPGYKDGVSPLGAYPAISLLSPTEWSEQFAPSYDVAIAQLASPLELQLGGRGVAFNRAPRTSYQIFGYPGKPSPPYNGNRLIACDAGFYGLENSGAHPFSTVASPCGMAQGASGGGWVNSAGQVVSVSSHIYTDPALAGLIVGPYFGDAAKALYNRAGGSAECPPAKQAFSSAKKKLKTARTADRRKDSARSAKKLRGATKRFNRAKARRDTVC
jgi:Trypsin-like peptidase domain